MKRKKIKKVVSLLLACGMLCMTMACGSDSNAKDTQNVQESQGTKENQAANKQDGKTEEKQEEQLEEKTIQLWLMGPGKQKDSDLVWAEFNKELQKTLPNTTVEFNVFPASEYKDKFYQMLASKEGVDLAWSGYATSLDQDIKDGNLMELDTLLDQYGADIKEKLGSTVMDISKTDGKTYYVVSWQGLVGDRTGMLVPTELAKLAGDTWVSDMNEVTKEMVSQPTEENKTKFYDEMEKYLKACKDAGKLYGGLHKMTFSFSGFPQRTLGLGNNFFLVYGDDSFQVQDDIERSKDFYEKMADFYQKGYWRSDILSMKQNYFSKDGTYGNDDAITYTHNAFLDNAQFEKVSSAKFCREMSLIRFYDSFQMTKGKATVMTIPYCADEPERAMMVLNELYRNKELYQLLIYGIEGKHYTKNADGTITTPYGSQGTADSDYGLWKWTIGTCENSLITQSDSAGYYEFLKAAEKDAYVSPFLNFTFDRSPVEAIYSAVSAVNGEYYSQLTYGAAGADWEKLYNKWQEERKQAGADQLREEMQRQVDEYVKENNITSWNYTNK